MISLGDVAGCANLVGFQGLLPLLPDFCHRSVPEVGVCGGIFALEKGYLQHPGSACWTDDMFEMFETPHPEAQCNVSEWLGGAYKSSSSHLDHLQNPKHPRPQGPRNIYWQWGWGGGGLGAPFPTPPLPWRGAARAGSLLLHVFHACSMTTPLALVLSLCDSKGGGGGSSCRCQPVQYIPAPPPPLRWSQIVKHLY